MYIALNASCTAAAWDSDLTALSVGEYHVTPLSYASDLKYNMEHTQFLSTSMHSQEGAHTLSFFVGAGSCLVNSQPSASASPSQQSHTKPSGWFFLFSAVSMGP
jgi:hypothetical protein